MMLLALCGTYLGMGVFLASFFSNIPRPLHRAMGSSGKRYQIPVPDLISEPAAALLVASTRGEVNQNVVGSLSEGVRLPFLVPKPRLWSKRVFCSQPSSKK